MRTIRFERTYVVKGFWWILWVWIDSFSLGFLLQFWPILDPASFASEFCPAFAHNVDLMEHPVVHIFVRCWAYLVIVFSAVQGLVFTYGDLQSVAVFQVAATLGELLHLTVYTSFVAYHGEWATGVVISYAIPSFLFFARCTWLYKNALVADKKAS